MNPTPSSRPRFTCRWVRTVNALVAGAGVRHLATCDDCQAAFRAAAQLEQDLGTAALARRQSAPAPSRGLEQSILRAMREAQAPAEPARSWSPAWAAGAVAAALVLGGLFVQRSMMPGAIDSAPGDALAMVDAVQGLSAEITERVIPSAGAAVANNPLQEELGSVYSDARSALNFLALNFMPPAPSVPAAAAKSAI